MSLVIPHILVGGTKARASDVMDNFKAIQAKFTQGIGGIDASDIAATAGILGSQLSTASGSRITAANLETGAVDQRALFADPISGSPNAAVNTTNHIRDGIITSSKLVDGTLLNAKIADGTILREKLNLVSITVTSGTIPGVSGGNLFFTQLDTGITPSIGLPLLWHVEGTGSPAQTVAAVIVKPFLDVNTNHYYMLCSNPSAGTCPAFTLRVWYLAV